MVDLGAAWCKGECDSSSRGEDRRKFPPPSPRQSVFKVVHSAADREVCYLLKIDVEKCKGCQLCVPACPRELLEPSQHRNSSATML